MIVEAGARRTTSDGIEKSAELGTRHRCDRRKLRAIDGLAAFIQIERLFQYVESTDEVTIVESFDRIVPRVFPRHVTEVSRREAEQNLERTHQGICNFGRGDDRMIEVVGSNGNKGFVTLELGALASGFGSCHNP